MTSLPIPPARVCLLCGFLLGLVVSAASAVSGDDAAIEAGDVGADTHHAHQEGDAMHASMTGAAPLPDRSIYQLGGVWTDPRGAELRLSELRGHPVLVLLFYGTCEHACPILVRDLQQIEARLEPQVRESLRLLLVTFDPEVDTPERLATYAQKNGLEAPRWVLAHGSQRQIRELSMVLGVRYRPTGDGQFSHTSRITLLDREGVVAAQADGLSADATPILESLRSMGNAR